VNRDNWGGTGCDEVEGRETEGEGDAGVGWGGFSVGVLKIDKLSISEWTSSLSCIGTAEFEKASHGAQVVLISNLVHNAQQK
jgi:hypothetical protein